jgi:hypothetical protein
MFKEKVFCKSCQGVMQRIYLRIWIPGDKYKWVPFGWVCPRYLLGFDDTDHGKFLEIDEELRGNFEYDLYRGIRPTLKSR